MHVLRSSVALKDVVKMAKMLNDLVNGVRQSTKMQLAKNGRLQSFAILFRVGLKENTYIVPMPFHNEKEKDACAALLKAAVAKVQPDAVVFISDSWIATSDKPTPFGPVRNMPNRKSAIVVFGTTRDHAFGVYCAYRNEEGQYYFEVRKPFIF